MPADRTRIDGPTPFYVKAIPGGVQLECDGLRRQVVEDVLTALLDPSDSGLWDRLHEVAELTPETPLPEGRMPFEELVSDLAERSSYRVTLYGRDGVLELTRVLRAAVAPKAVPTQREAGAA